MYCTNCLTNYNNNNNNNNQLRTSAKRRASNQCEHCGLPVDERGRPLNKNGVFTDCKGLPKPKKIKRIPAPRTWVSVEPKQVKRKSA